MKHNTLSLSLLLSAALVVPTVAMAELIGYNETPAAANGSTMPTEEAVKEDNTDLTTLQPNVNNVNQPSINDGSQVTNDIGSEAANNTVDAGTQQLGQQNNAEAYPPVTTPTDYAAPQDPEAEAPATEDDFQ